MSPERFTDALNYLDDDLIQQTDDLRQGRRVLQKRPAARQVIRWAAPAACLVLLLGVATMFPPNVATEDAAQFGEEVKDQMIDLPGEMYGYEEANTGNSTRNESVTAGWQEVSCGGISLSIPEDWEYELEPGEDNSLFIAIRPAGELGELKIGYMPNFGVCGTGLTEKETTIAGMKAMAGYYDGSSRWSFITFPEEEKWHVILKDGADAWWSTHGETAMEILETIVFDETE